MADINIQRKKSSPSPWLLVLLAALALGVAAYFFLRPAPADEPAPAVATAAPETVVDTAAVSNAYEQVEHRAAINAIPGGDSTAQPPAHTVEGVASPSTSETAASLAAQAASDSAAPNYARNGLEKLAGVLVALTYLDDLRDPSTTEQRDNLTSATNRLGEPNSSLRPGFVAAAGLIRALQQKAYPALEEQANEMVRLSGQVSGRSATAADQQLNKQFLTKAAEVVRVLSEPAK